MAVDERRERAFDLVCWRLGVGLSPVSKQPVVRLPSGVDAKEPLAAALDAVLGADLRDGHHHLLFQRRATTPIAYERNDPTAM